MTILKQTRPIIKKMMICHAIAVSTKNNRRQLLLVITPSKTFEAVKKEVQKDSLLIFRLNN